jgi:hypothetical protein
MAVEPLPVGIVDSRSRKVGWEISKVSVTQTYHICGRIIPLFFGTSTFLIHLTTVLSAMSPTTGLVGDIVKEYPKSDLEVGYSNDFIIEKPHHLYPSQES